MAIYFLDGHLLFGLKFESVNLFLLSQGLWNFV